jgi:lysophospholipase L1-like esterase
VFVVDDQWSGFYEGGAAVLAALAVFAVLGATRDGVLARVLAWRPLVALGAISYAVYLWHWPLLLALRREGLEGARLDVTVVLATLVVSVVSLWLVETPIRRGSWLRGWRPIGAGFAVVALVGGVVVGLTPTAVPADAVTVDEALASVVEQSAVRATAEPPNITAADAAAGESEPEVEPEQFAPVTVALVGDSAAWTLGGGELGLRTDHGPYVSPFDPDEIVLLNLARKGYRLVPGATVDFGQTRPRPTDDLESEEWWRETVTAARPDLVVVMFGMADLQGRLIDDVLVPFGTPEFEELVRVAATDLLGDLADVAPVVILTTPPLIGADMPVEVMSEFFDRFSGERAAELNRILVDVAATDPRYSMIDFAGRLCPGSAGAGFQNGCLVDGDGNPVRHDGVHFTTQGAELAAEILTPLLLDRPEPDPSEAGP